MGAGEWNGEWSDKWRGWTPALKKELKLVDKDDGLFWMAMEDVEKLFKNVQVCKYVDNHEYSYAESFGSNHSVFKFEVTEPGEYTFSVCQISTRMYPKGGKYRSHFPARLLVLKQTGGSGKNKRFTVVGSGSDSGARDVYAECAHLDAGTYYLLGEVEFPEEGSCPVPKWFTVTCYGAFQVVFFD